MCRRRGIRRAASTALPLAVMGPSAPPLAAGQGPDAEARRSVVVRLTRLAGAQGPIEIIIRDASGERARVPVSEGADTAGVRVADTDSTLSCAGEAVWCPDIGIPTPAPAAVSLPVYPRGYAQRCRGFLSARVVAKPRPRRSRCAGVLGSAAARYGRWTPETWRNAGTRAQASPALRTQLSRRGIPCALRDPELVRHRLDGAAPRLDPRETAIVERPLVPDSWRSRPRQAELARLPRRFVHLGEGTLRLQVEVRPQAIVASLYGVPPGRGRCGARAVPAREVAIEEATRAAFEEELRYHRAACAAARCSSSSSCSF